MKIAYTINGLLGGFSDKNSSTSDKSKDSIIILQYVSNLLQKNIVEPNDVDLFVFSWHTDFENEFNKFLKPTSLKLEEQIDFEIFEHLRGAEDKRVNAHLSRWYGFKEVINLVNEHEKQHSFEYDLVLNSRFDVCWNRPFDFNKLDTDKFHIPWHPDIPNYGWPFGSPEILDHVYASNSKNMKLYSTMYDELENYTLPGNCPSWRTISHHFLMVWHLRELGLLDHTVKSFANWDYNNPKLQGGSEDDLEIDYDIFRNRKFTKQEVIEKNGKTKDNIL